MNQTPTLYARTATGAIQQWNIEYENDHYRTIYGQVGGKLIITEWTTVKATNVGRANERGISDQASFAANAVWTKKKASGYWEDIKGIDKIAFIEPMLAQNFKDREDEIDWSRGVY